MPETLQQAGAGQKGLSYLIAIIILKCPSLTLTGGRE